MSIPKGEISFRPRTLLRVDGSILESEFINPSELHDFIIASTDKIATHVEKIHRHDLAKARRPELRQRSAIHVARLALHEWNRSVFNTLNMQEVEKITNSPRMLVPTAKEYWDAVHATSFLPQIHIRSPEALEGTSGVWLSLKSLD